MARRRNGGGKPDKKKKERFVARIKRRGREAKALGTTLVNEPKAFPAEAGGVVKRGLRTMWQARGGGFYAVGFVLTFLYLEARTLVREVGASDGVVSFFTEQAMEFLFRFSIQSIQNTALAFVWPFLVLDAWHEYGLVALAAGYLLFAYVLKDRLTEWLFDGQDNEQG